VKIWIAIVALFCSVGCIAQDAVPEPQFNDVFTGLDSGKLIPLEQQSGAIQGKASGFISMNMKGSWEIPGTKSPVRFHSGQPLDFVVRSYLAATLDTSGVDPRTGHDDRARIYRRSDD
jgi:hypothetical protein